MRVYEGTAGIRSAQLYFPGMEKLSLTYALLWTFTIKIVRFSVLVKYFATKSNALDQRVICVSGHLLVFLTITDVSRVFIEIVT